MKENAKPALQRRASSGCSNDGPVAHNALSATAIAVDYGASSICERIEHHARRQPQRLAVRYGSTALTFADLNGRANRLASHLHQRGVKGNVPVCVLLDPSLESVIALLAILKLRAIYVPLDVDHPLLRLNAIIADVGPAAVVCRTRFQAIACGDRRVDIDNVALRARTADSDVDSASFADGSLAAESFATEAGPNESVGEDSATTASAAAAMAYIFYTSGTTGRPKGVIGTQANLLQYVMSAVATFEMDSATIMPALARTTFSISLFELLCPLVAGGCVVMLDRAHILDLPSLAQTLQAMTMFHIGPSLLRKLLDAITARHIDFNAFDRLRHVSSGGDMVRPELLERVKSVFCRADIFVIYGCSEVACMGCFYPVPRERTATRPLVGKAFPNVGVALLHQDGGGDTGEICFTGAGVTRGYLHLPELTAQKYIDIDSQRFYRTGDIGRLDADGNIEMLGRADFQVKLHGIRVELGDIEAHLYCIDGVRDAVVAAVDGNSGERRLCAYLVLDPQHPPTLSAIRLHLEQQLPDYMVPAYFVLLDRLPLNHNLKLDRQALPPPSAANLITSCAFAAPEDAIEARLVEIWKSILQLDSVGTRHDFFELGGDSLLAANLIVEVEREFGLRVSIAAFLAAPTIADIARMLLQPASHIDGDLYIAREGAQPALFLLHGALVYHDIVAHLEPDQAACVLYAQEEAHLIGSKNAADFFKLYASIEALAERYLRAITAHQPCGPYHLGGYSIGGLIALEVARRLERAGQEIGSIFLFDCFVPSLLHGLSWQRVRLHARDLMAQGLPYFRSRWQKLAAVLAVKRSLAAGESAVELPDERAYIEELRRLARKHATASYVPQRVERKVVLFKATERSRYEPDHPTLGWKKLIADLDVYAVHGNHGNVLKGDSAHFIANKINAYLGGRT